MRIAFRIAVYTLEYIEKNGLSLEKSFKRALTKSSIRGGEIVSQSYEYCRTALFSYSLADLILNKNYFRKISLRKKCAFRIAFGLLRKGYRLREVIYDAGGLLDRYLIEILREFKDINVEELVDRKDKIKFLSIKYSYPKFIAKRLVELLGEEEAEKVFKKDLKATEWIRINTLKVDIDKAVKKLEKMGVIIEKDKDFPELYKVVKSKVPLSTLKLVREFKVIIQDKGSVAVVHALNPAEGEVIIDATAAPGMKTSLIAQLADNRAYVIAIDISRRRIYEMKNLLNKMNVRNVDIVLADSSNLGKMRGDKVLIDAPCSNSGAIGKDPALRIILEKEENILRHTIIQWKLLENFIKNNENIIYSVCSYLPEEGEEVIKKAIEKYGINLVRPKVLGVNGYKKYNFSRNIRRLFPHLHSSTGFFISYIEKFKRALI